MSPLYTYLGKLLVSDSKLAASSNCCCEYTTDCETCEENTITISLCIDGSDFFILQGCFLTSEHRNWQDPQSCDGCEQATVNGEVWPFLIKNNPFDLRTINKKFGKASNITVNKISGRGNIVITQQPALNNNWTAKILVDDDDTYGPDCYSFEITWTC